LSRWCVGPTKIVKVKEKNDIESWMFNGVETERMKEGEEDN